MLALILWLVIGLIVASLAWWITAQFPEAPPFVIKVVRILIVVLACFWMIHLLMGLASHPVRL